MAYLWHVWQALWSNGKQEFQLDENGGRSGANRVCWCTGSPSSGIIALWKDWGLYKLLVLIRQQPLNLPSLHENNLVLKADKKKICPDIYVFCLLLSSRSPGFLWGRGNKGNICSWLGLGVLFICILMPETLLLWLPCLFYLLSLFLQFVTTQSFFPPAAAMGHKQQSGGREPGFYIRPVCTAQGI